MKKIMIKYGYIIFLMTVCVLMGSIYELARADDRPADNSFEAANRNSMTGQSTMQTGASHDDNQMKAESDNSTFTTDANFNHDSRQGMMDAGNTGSVDNSNETHEFQPDSAMGAATATGPSHDSATVNSEVSH